MVAVLEAVRETVDVRVVDEGVVAISPGELLGPDAEVIIGDKWRRLVLGGVGEDERGDVGQHDGGARHHEEGSSPSLPVSVRVTCGHLPGLGHVGGLHQTKQGAPQQRHGFA